ncbi:MAG: heme biosynthesis protein HemY [Pseudomonadota bacterium]
MIWSFAKIALFIVAIAALTLGAGYLAQSGGGLRLTLANVEYTLGPMQTMVAVIVLLVALWVLLKLIGLAVAVLRFISGDETAVSRYFTRNRDRKGYRALADSLLALANGEPRLALAQAQKAEKLLKDPQLTALLTAQAAEACGDTARAAAVYKDLLRDERSRFAGVRGLLRQKLAEGDTATALKLAQKAFGMKPRHEEVQDVLLQLTAREGDWKAAREVLGAKARQGLLPRDLFRRRDAVLALQEAKVLLDDQSSFAAREAAIAANRASPDLIPAAVLAARSYTAEGKKKLAAKLLKKAWEAQPHPDLAAAFAAIEPDESPQARLRRFAPILATRPEADETRLLAAELNIAAEDFPAARRAVGDLADTHPTARVLTIMAAIERGQGGSEAAVRGWLARAVTASRGPQWVCDHCENVMSDWAPVCDECGGLDTLSWREPKNAARGTAINGAEMLPLIVGALPPGPSGDLDPVGESGGDAGSDAVAGRQD